MNVFGENLQFYRKQKNMTQEQLAEVLEVSRQTVSKWEAGTSYPEMEKILQLCDFFSCDMDTLLRKDAVELEAVDSQGYEKHMEKQRKSISAGVMLLILSPAVYELLDGIHRTPEVLMNTIFFGICMAGILTLVTAGIQDSIYRKSHPVIADFYTKEEREKFAEKFPRRIAGGIGTILAGLLIGMNGEGLPVGPGMTEEFYNGIFLLFVSVGVGILIHTGMGSSKYDLEKYNKENSFTEEKAKTEQKIGVWCGCIMLMATIVFCIGGFVLDRWDISWLSYPIGGIFCGMAALILHGKEKK